MIKLICLGGVMKPTVALVGRPNVGKSTLFNKIAGKKISIIEDTPGVTRDRIYSEVSYGSYKFNLIDTGGIDVSQGDFNDEIKIQVEIAIDESDVIIFVVDGIEGPNQNDYVIRDMLRRFNKRVIVAINKTDNKLSLDHKYDFYELGFNEYVEISGEHSRGIGELLDLVTENFTPYEEEAPDSKVKFAIIGRPNVGKSSLVNAIVGEEKAIVSNIAGTTRDAVDTEFTYDKEDYVIIDTAGIRKSGKIYENIEKYSVLRAMKAIERSNVCVVVINAEEGIIEHDKHIASYALEAGKPIVLVVNKWDTITDKTIAEYTKLMRNEFQFLSYSPIVFLSAKTKKRIHTLMPEIKKVYENSKKEIKTSILNDVVREAVILNQPPSYKGKRLKIYFVHQAGTMPPKFIFNVNSNKLIHFSYERYLENKLRESFDFEGTPIQIEFKNKGDNE
jgi:GTP-binding protein